MVREAPVAVPWVDSVTCLVADEVVLAKEDRVKEDRVREDRVREDPVKVVPVKVGLKDARVNRGRMVQVHEAKAPEATGLPALDLRDHGVEVWNSIH